MSTATPMTAEEYFAVSVVGDMTQLVDVVADEHNVFGPDVVWLSEEGIPDRLDKRLAGMPDLAVEVRSPSTWRYDIGSKRAAYERAGLPELWLSTPHRER